MGAPPRKAAPYLFYGQTISLCAVCHGLVPAKIVVEDNSVYYLKRCRQHGVQKTLVSSDFDYFKTCLDYLKPADRPQNAQTRTDFGCPFDCGLCPDHEQHSCLAILDIADECNLTCPVCYADSGPKRQNFRTLEDVASMMDVLVESEGEPDLLQISGGEPTLHPQILDIIAMAKGRPIRHIMLNTNGLRIARDPDFVAQLAAFKPGFEVYLQFDSLKPEALKILRGADLGSIRRQALENLERHEISTTLVAVMKKGVNDDEAGGIIEHALKWRCVRGVTFQPIQDAGRNDGYSANDDRLVLSDIRSRIIESGTGFEAGDIIPLPCNPESIAIGYALRNGQSIVPITSLIPKDMIVSAVPNAISFEKYPDLQKRIFEFFSLSTTPGSTSERLEALLCCLPEVPAPAGLGYDNIFRVAIVEFLDAHNFCLGRVKRSCIHFLTPQGQIIPFDTHNLFYRNGRIRQIRQSLADGRPAIRQT